MTPEQLQQINELMEFKRNMEDFRLLPSSVERAIKGRVSVVTSSTKGATSEDQAVSEAGSGSYNVLKSPDGFVQVVIGNATVYIPKYN